MQGSGGPMVGVSLAPSLQAELGTDHRFVADENWTMGWAGVRYTLDGRGLLDVEQAHLGPTLDLETGFGAGVGGVDRREDPPPSHRELDWSERLALGNYAGLGAGFHFVDWASVFARGRVQLTKAELVPTTLWGSAAAGVELSFEPVALYLATAIAGYDNSLDDELGWIPAEAGLSLRFDMPTD